jgi:hypothetical protein
MLSCRLARLSHVKSKTPDEIQFIHPAHTYKFLKTAACRGKKPWCVLICLAQDALIFLMFAQP